MSTDRETALAIRQILDTHAGLSAPARVIRSHEDLFAKGLTGLAAVDVLLAVEAAFGVIFPPAMMARRTVGSIDALIESLRSLQAQRLAA